MQRILLKKRIRYKLGKMEIQICVIKYRWRYRLDYRNGYRIENRWENRYVLARNLFNKFN